MHTHGHGQMVKSIIVAMDRSGLIGAGGTLPWRLAEDMQHFRRVTIGKPCVMGRTTFESLGRPLADRQNIVVTSRPLPATDEANHEVITARSLSEAYGIAAGMGAAECMVIGGARIYAEALPTANRIYLTSIDASFPVKGAGRAVYFPSAELEARPRRIMAFEGHAATALFPHAWSIQVFDLG